MFNKVKRASIYNIAGQLNNIGYRLPSFSESVDVNGKCCFKTLSAPNSTPNSVDEEETLSAPNTTPNSVDEEETLVRFHDTRQL